MGTQKIQPWSEILDGYEVKIDKQDYEHTFVLMDRKEGVPVMDVVNDDVSFIFVADTEEALRASIDASIPTALQSDDTFVFDTNWAFIRTKYRALNYNGKRITIDGTDDAHSDTCATSVFSTTLIPSLQFWFTVVFQMKGNDSFGVLSKKIDGKDFAVVADSSAEMLALLMKSNNDDIAVATMASPATTLASMNLTKISGACDGILYRGVPLLLSDIYEEVERCITKFDPENDGIRSLLDAYHQIYKHHQKETEDK